MDQPATLEPIAGTRHALPPMIAGYAATLGSNPDGSLIGCVCSGIAMPNAHGFSADVWLHHPTPTEQECTDCDKMRDEIVRRYNAFPEMWALARDLHEHAAELVRMYGDASPMSAGIVELATRARRLTETLYPETARYD